MNMVKGIPEVGYKNCSGIVPWGVSEVCSHPTRVEEEVSAALALKGRGSLLPVLFLVL